MTLILGFLCFFSFWGLLSARQEAVVFVVDPRWDCVASYVAHVPLLQEYKIIKVMTRLGESTWCSSDNVDIFQTFTYNSWQPNDALAAEDLCPKLRSVGVPIAAVIATFDPAVALTDRLAACVGARGNLVDGPQGSKARHDKWAMNEAVRKAGIRAAREVVITSWDEAKEVLESWSPPLSHAHPVIFKILQGSSSEGVQKVYSMKQAKEIVSREIGTTSKFGTAIGKILIMEYLNGPEYVVDSVSRDGVHKVNMVWYEDLRPGNGIFNLYYGFKVMDPEDQKTKVIIDYANKVLDATGLRNGAADMEVMWPEGESGPCIIDLNARWTALMWDDGLALEKAVAGEDQITATINAYLDGDAFNKMPLVPTVSQHGAVLFMNVWHTGILRGVPGQAVVEKLPSYFGSVNDHAAVGKLIEKFTAGTPPITVLLAHKDRAVLDSDYDRVIDLEYADAFFDITPSTEYTSLHALSVDGHQWLAIAAVAFLAVAAAFAHAATLQRNRDDTEYVSVE